MIFYGDKDMTYVILSCIVSLVFFVFDIEKNSIKKKNVDFVDKENLKKYQDVKFKSYKIYSLIYLVFAIVFYFVNSIGQKIFIHLYFLTIVFEMFFDRHLAKKYLK